MRALLGHSVTAAMEEKQMDTKRGGSTPSTTLSSSPPSHVTSFSVPGLPGSILAGFSLILCF